MSAFIPTNEPEYLLVFGYIHELEPQLILDIPEPIIHLCLQFYFLDEDSWDKKSIDSGLEIDGNILRNTADGYMHCFGVKSVRFGKYVWKIKCLNVQHSFAIGVIDEQKAKPNINQYFYNLQHAYGYRQDGAKISNSIWNHHWGDTYQTDDIISVILDLNNCTIAFKKNDKDLGIAYENIPKIAYKLALYSYNAAGVCELYASGRDL